MTSGEQSAGGRTCLKAGEVDPAGQAQACVEPTVEATVQPIPEVVALPHVGASQGLFSALLWVVVICICIWAISRRNRKK